MFSSDNTQQQPQQAQPTAGDNYVNGNQPGGVQPQQQPQQAGEQGGYDPEFVKFNDQFKRYAGVDFTEAVSSIRELQTYRQQQAVSQQKSQLAQVWDADESTVESRLPVVQDAWAKLSADEQLNIRRRAAGDEITMVNMLWQRIQEDEQYEQPYIDSGMSQQAPPSIFNQVRELEAQQRNNGGVPAIERNSPQAAPTGKSKKYAFSVSQINRMSNEEYKANANAIANAYAQNKVLRDI